MNTQVVASNFPQELRPHPKRLIGQLLRRGRVSAILYTPNDDRKIGELMHVHAIGDKARDYLPEVNVGAVVVLNPERYGTTLTITDDDGRTHEYHTVNADDVLSIWAGEL